jgi:F-type H+-transporting ATPase subunit b
MPKPGVQLTVALIVLLTAAAPALAAEDGIFGGSLMNAVWALIIFGLLLAVLGRYAWGPIVRQLEQREKKVAETIFDAERQRDEATAMLEEYRQKLDQAKAEAEKLMQKTVSDAEQVKQRIVDEAGEEARQARDRAVLQIGQAKKDALAGIFAQAAELATDAAGQILRRELSPQDHQRLVEETLAQFDQQQSSRN